MTDNELIAEFMGLKPEKHSALYDNPTGLSFDRAVEPLYYKSWDWLMPVVERIEKHGAIVEINICLATMCRIVVLNGSRDRIKDFTNGGSIPLIDAVYLSVVEFIKWYNTQNSGSVQNKLGR